ncbi:hypothetical protein COMNV_01181 [Commensalibacter sp. Nvir]|nr:hypothetical protein COMNV_01181 [Commensalibacter sp. Nvir]
MVKMILDIQIKKNKKALLKELESDLSKDKECLSNFDFYQPDQETIQKLVYSIEDRIYKLTKKCYYQNKVKNKLENFLKDEIKATREELEKQNKKRSNLIKIYFK